ncbi:unnamed protein product, partial [Iphiclides podalirius]
MHTMDTMGYGHKKYRPPISPTNFYHHDYYSRHNTLRPQSVLQSEYRFAGGGYPRVATSSGGSGGGLCSAALVVGALLAAVAVLAVAALAFYMGALRPDNGEPIMTFEGNFRVTRGDVYGGVPGSPAWNERARRYSVALRQAFNAPSSLRQAFVGAVVTGFGDRKLDVHFRLYLDRRKIPSTVSNIEESLKNILVHDLLSKQPSFGQIKIDTSSIAIKRDLEHTSAVQAQKLMEELNTENYLLAHNLTNNDEEDQEMTTTPDFEGYETENHEMLASLPGNSDEIIPNISTSNRFPKSSTDLNTPHMKDHSPIEKAHNYDKEIPEGFKILTKTYHKTQPTKQEENHFNSPEKSHNKPHTTKPQKEKEIIKDMPKEDDCSNATSFRCLTGLCLPDTSRCNRLMDCPGGEDERACSCADYLRAEFSQTKICDGVVDCWDYSDENKCEWCKEGQYVCSNARQCIDMSRVCDGTPDCPLGDDEKTCVALSDDIEDNEVVPYNEEGFVMVRKRGEWGRLCVESFADVVAEAHSSLKLPDLGRAVCRAMTFSESRWAREAREGRRLSSAGYWEVWHNKAARAADTRLTFRRAECARRKALRVRCHDLECGVRPHAEAQQPRDVTHERMRWGRVVGGGGAAAGAWPWQAALYRDGDFQCGATLISAQWLLSASHCFYQATEAHWVARLGALRRGAWPRGPWEQVARVRQLVLHPRYAARGFRNDIALLRVEPVQLHARLRPACLPPPRAAPPAGRHCTVVGWGQLYEHERVFPDTLQEVELPVISTAECRRRTRLLPLYRVTEDMFCAGYERGGRDACLGDSGGPLMCQEGSKWYIYGVTSNGYGCARANRPGVYTKVSNYIDWIDGVIAANTPHVNDTAFGEAPESAEDFYVDLQTAENRRRAAVDTCRGFRCPLGECLPASSACNGFLECSDGSDEWNCHALNTTSVDPD